ncbi:sphingolipid transporter [Aureococcus anophagefferens]|nr:sphingolipid transporter [Aureococcus anophagefferens]
MIGYSKTYAEVLLWRLALGFGQAFSNPASYSLIADYFPEAQRAQANSLFACGVCGQRRQRKGSRRATATGTASGRAALEGLVAERTWRRQARRRRRQRAGAGPPKTFKQALAAIFGNRLVVLVFAASSLRYMGGYSVSGRP